MNDRISKINPRVSSGRIAYLGEQGNTYIMYLTEIQTRETNIKMRVIASSQLGGLE